MSTKLLVPSKIIKNADIHLFGFKDNELRYLPRISVWRIMLHSKRIILKAFIPLDKIKIDFIDGADSIHFLVNICANPSEYVADAAIIKLNNLQLYRSWLMNVISMHREEKALCINAEYEFSDYWISDNYYD